MGPAYFVMAVLGCGDAGAMCVDVRDTGRVYRSQIECAAATEAALNDAMDVSYPEVAVQCRAISAQNVAARMAAGTLTLG